jgi:hypothetical protein
LIGPRDSRQTDITFSLDVWLAIHTNRAFENTASFDLLGANSGQQKTR